MMDWGAILGYVLAAVAAACAWVWRNRRRVLQVASEAALWAEKYHDAGATNADLEAQAVKYVREHWPEAPEALVVLAIRELCARRREVADLKKSSAWLR